MVDVVPMPVQDSEVVPSQLAEILRLWMSESEGDVKCCIEQVHSMPKQGVSTTFKFGKSFGIAIGVVGGLGIPMHRMRPQAWKKEVGLSGRGKDASRFRATELWPSWADAWKLKKQDGKAEAGLIAEAARRTL